GEEVRIAFAQHGASIGTLSPEGFHFVVQGLMNSGLLQGTRLSGPNPYQGWEVTLTFAGWERFEELRRGTPSGRRHSWLWSTEARALTGSSTTTSVLRSPKRASIYADWMTTHEQD